MRSRSIKIVGILLSYTVIGSVYPHIRFNRNWTNNDFIHQVPKLATAVDNPGVFTETVSGNSAMYHIAFVEYKLVTGLPVHEVYLYAIPLAVGFASATIMIAFVRRYASYPHWLLVVGVLLPLPIYMDLRSGGKHSVFTYSVFFLILSLLADSEDLRNRGVLFLLTTTVVLLHIYIGGILVGFLASYQILRGVSGHTSAFRNTTPYLALAGSIAWTFYFIASPGFSFVRIVYGIVPPYPTAGGATTSTGAGSVSGGGFAQYVDVLTLRWDPWWIWGILTIPLFIIVFAGLAAWIRRSVILLSRREIGPVSDSYILTTIAGLLCIGVLAPAIGGFSATNLIFRYLVYLAPIAAVLAAVELLSKHSFRSRSIQVLLVFLVITAMVVGPIKTSREPEFQQVNFGNYQKDYHHAVAWAGTTGENMTVSSTLNAQAVYIIELTDYRPGGDLPIKTAGAPLHLLSRSEIEGNRNRHQVYSNGEIIIASNTSSKPIRQMPVIAF